MRLRDKRHIHLIHTLQSEAWYLTTNDTLAEMATYEGHVVTLVPYYGKVRTGIAQAFYRQGEVVASAAYRYPKDGILEVYGADSISDIPIRE